jgi:hypothetical protein
MNDSSTPTSHVQELDMTDTIATRGQVHRLGAPLLPPTIVYALLTLAATIVPGAMAGSGPWTSDHDLLDFFQHHGSAAHTSAFLMLGSAIPLAIATAVATTRLRTLGVDVPGRIIAQVGGTIASAMLALSALATMALTRSQVADSPAAVRALYALSFAVGGPGFVVFSGLLVAGISVAGLLGRVLPRWLAWAGIVVALASELASLSAAFNGADFLLPIGRFGGLAWLVGIGFTLPATRRELRERRGIVREADLS